MNFLSYSSLIDAKSMSKALLKSLKPNLATESWLAELVTKICTKSQSNLPFLVSWLIRSLNKALGGDFSGI